MKKTQLQLAYDNLLAAHQTLREAVRACESPEEVEGIQQKLLAHEPDSMPTFDERLTDLIGDPDKFPDVASYRKAKAEKSK